jgi:glyoxylase-like metal-dependent hydrolase (beta-lactamase superfamily II)
MRGEGMNRLVAALAFGLGSVAAVQAVDGHPITSTPPVTAATTATTAAPAAPAAPATAATAVTAAAGTTAAPAASDAATVRLAVVRVASLPVREGMLFSGGRFGEMATTNFSAFVIEHGSRRLLLDTGLGAGLTQQYAADMPNWGRPFFRAPEQVDPVRRQLDAAGIGEVSRVVLTHAHWDHASGLEDFPGAEVWAAEAELATVRAARSGIGTAWPSQVGSPGLRWRAFTFAGPPFEGFERSEDLFGDGRVVVVPMAGHTPGSVGLFVTVSSGRRFFFVGDVVWTTLALAEARPKFWPARQLVDADVEATQRTIMLIRAAQRRDPELVVVPAHDALVQDRLGYFPRWIE